VTLKIEAKDNIDLEKVEIFIDNVLTATLTGLPYEFDWDSNTVGDGNHIIKVVVTDSSGNESSSEVSVIVRNILVYLSIANDQLYDEEGYSERGFIFLSDESGKVIVSTEYQNGQIVELKSSDFDGATFYLTEAILDDEGGSDEFLSLFTYPHVERGNWSVLDRRESDPVFIGEASLNFTNATADYSYDLITGEDATFANESYLTPTIRLTKSPSNLYIVSRSNTPGIQNKFRKFSGIVVGNNSTIDLSQVDQLLTQSVAILPEGTVEAAWELYGFDASQSFDDAYSLGYIGDYDNPTLLTVEYPGAAFPSYYSESYLEASTFSYGASGTQVHDFIPLQYNYNFVPGSGTLSYSASGNFDFISANYLNPDFTAGWFFMLPKGSNQTLILPELPSILSGKGAPNLAETPTHYSIYDFSSLESYDDVKNYIRQSTNGIVELFERGRQFKQMDFYSTSGSGSREKMTRRTSP
jgi:hypothetical protein